MRQTKVSKSVKAPSKPYKATVLTKQFNSLQKKGNFKSIDIANITGKSAATVSRWTSGQVSPQAKTQILITELSYVTERLAELYSPAEIRLWLFARNPMLDERMPIELITQGRTEEVLTVIDQLLDGVYL